MNKVLVLTAALALSAGCTKKKTEDKTPPTTGSGSAMMGSGSDTMAGSGSAAMAPPADPKVVERGAYLVKAGACLVCHTGMGPKGPDLDNPGAGGLEMKEKFGTWRSPNITPDKGTGIGNWTDDQIIAAFREGTRPDGTKLLPIMPYMNYNVLSDADAKAVVAFLRSLKPVERTVAKSEAKMDAPPVPKPTGAEPAADKKGEYMASVMLCNHCHWTPNKEGTAPAGMDKMFSGGLPMEFPPLGEGTLFSRNITSDNDTGIGKWTEEQIFTAIKTMTKPDGKMINGPMILLQGGWAQLTDDDLKAVAKFIKALPAVKNKVPDSTFKPHPMGPPPGAGSGGGSAAGGSGAPAGSGADPHAGHDMKGGDMKGSAAETGGKKE